MCNKKTLAFDNAITKRESIMKYHPLTKRNKQHRK